MENDIDKLLESLDEIEKQRSVLGDVIDPVISDIRGKLFAEVPEPTEDQRTMVQSWQTVRETSEGLGLTTPAATPEIEEAVAAVDRYEGLLARLGGTGTETVVSEPVATPEPKPPTTDATAPVGAAAPSPQPEDTGTTEGAPTVSFEIVCGETPIKLTPSTKDMAKVILEALAGSPDGSVKTTDLLRSVTGGIASIEINLMKRGHRPIPEGVDINEARRLSDCFYRTLKQLRTQSIIEHEYGSSRSGAEKPGAPKSGVIRKHGDIHFTQQDNGHLVIEVSRKPFRVGVDMFRQLIDNGHGAVLEVKKGHQQFARVVRAIGSIAGRTPEEQAKIRRSQIGEWMTEKFGTTPLTTEELASVSSDLKDLVRLFKGDFPLQEGEGQRGGAYFTWEPDTQVDIIETIDKPDFENPVFVKIDGEVISLDIDGQTLVLFDPEDSALKSGVISQGVSIDNIRSRYLDTLLVLSLMEEDDKISAEQLYIDVNGTEEGDTRPEAYVNWLRRLKDRINGRQSADVINYTSHSGIVIDINRRFVFIDGSSDSSSEDLTELVDADSEPSPAPETDEQDSQEDPVSAKKSADALVNSAMNLPKDKREVMYKRLVEGAEFSRPKSLEEAVYLVRLVMDKGVLDRLHVHSRFNSNNSAMSSEDFIAQVLRASFIRLLSWGDMEDVMSVLSEKTRAKTDTFVSGTVKNLKDSKDSLLYPGASRTQVSSQHEREQDESFLQTAAVSLVDGIIPQPSTPRQAIALLEIFKASRPAIAQGKTRAEFDQFVRSMHNAVSSVLGRENMHVALEARSPGRARTRNVVQTGGTDNPAMHGTDAYRRPDGIRDDKDEQPKAPGRHTQ